jgi:predicted porin
MSLQVYGHVNEMLLFWDDGHTSDVYQVTNDVNVTRFGFRGSAKIDSDWSAGFRVEFGFHTASSDAVAQVVNPNPGDPPDPANLDLTHGDDLGSDFALRHAIWYIQSRTLGTLTVGQTDTPMSSTFSLSLANTPGVESDPSSLGSAFFLRATDGSFVDTDATWGDLMSPIASYSLSRRNGVRYDTPTLGGFQFQAGWGESDYWAVSLAYAGEFSGFRLAAKVAYSQISDSSISCQDSTVGTLGPPLVRDETDCQLWAAGASIMHVPTGLYITGNYGEQTDDLRAPDEDKTDVGWYLQGGIEQKFTQLGRTTVYGEYGEQEHGNLFAGYGGTTFSFWGVGINQSIDAAAMDLYLFYRNYSSEVPITFADPVEDLTIIGADAQIRF